jgi:hypothetical protein
VDPGTSVREGFDVKAAVSRGLGHRVRSGLMVHIRILLGGDTFWGAFGVSAPRED